MKLLADENCDASLVKELRAGGHDVVFIVESRPGADDLQVVRLAREQSRVILTADLDFGQLSEFERELPPGIVLIRLHPLQRASRVERVIEVLNSLGDAIRNNVVVIEPGQVRIRALGPEPSG